MGQDAWAAGWSRRIAWRDFAVPACFVACGALLAALALRDVLLLAGVARRLSSDGLLTADYVRLLRSAQVAAGAAIMVAAVLVRPLTAGLQRVQSALTRRRLDGMLTAGALLAGLLTWVVQGRFFEHVPHVSDAIAHCFQARIFCAGLAYAPLPPCFEHFFQFMLYYTQDGRWFATYPPGHALTLSLFARAGAAWLYGPAVVAAGAWAAGWLVHRFYGRTTAQAVLLLLAVSPLALILGASFMSHVSFFLYSAGGLALLVAGLDRMSRGGVTGPVGLLLAGVSLGFAFISRPQDAVLLGPAFLLAFLLAPGPWRARVLRAVPFLALGLSLPAALQLLWNDTIYGSPFALGYGRSLPSLTPLLLTQIGLSDTFPLSRAVQQFVFTTARFDQALLGWPTALPLALLPLLRWPWDRRDAVCAAGAGAVVGFYFFCNYYGSEYEARYYAAAIPFFLVLVARGLERVAVLTAAVVRRGSGAEARGTRFAVGVAAAGYLYAVLYYWPLYLVPRYGHDYEQVTRAALDAARRADLPAAVVLIDTAGENPFRYAAGFIGNDPQLTNRVIYARDLGRDRDGCLFEAFPERRLYRFIPNRTWTDGAFEEVTRPPAPGV